MKTTTNRYDIIADIHGHHDKLTALLHRLGYFPDGKTWMHPKGRKVIFLGDFIDRGPKIREVLRTVRGMMDAGEALAVMGNHELNAVLYATEKPGGGYLREHNENNVRGHFATLRAFAGRETEWQGWIEWMRHLPMFLEIEGLRAVHAAWADEPINFLRGKTLADDAFLNAAATKDTPEYKAVEFILKGPELHLPPGVTLRDKEGIVRRKTRVRWWDIGRAETLGDLVMPTTMPEVKAPLTATDRAALADYPTDAPPVFVGHYWMPADAPRKPMTRNVAVLDFGAGIGDATLYGYRWEGERELRATGFVTHEVVPVQAPPKLTKEPPRRFRADTTAHPEMPLTRV